MASQRTLELVLKIANQASSELQKVKAEFQGLSLNFGFDNNGFKAIIDQINQLKEAFGDTKSARDNAKLAQDVAKAQAEQLKVEQQAEKLAQDKLRTQQQEISLQQQISKQEEEIARKAEAAAKAEEAKTKVYGQQVQAIAGLAQSLGISYAEAEKLNKSLGLSADKINQAFQQLSQFDKVKLSKDEQFRSLQSSLGVTQEQFKALNEEYGKFGDNKKPAELKQGIANIAFAFNQVTQAIQIGIGVGQQYYQTLIGQNVELQNQILATQSSLAATNKVFQDGVEIKDPTTAVKALEAPVKAAVAEIRKGSLELSGVTSNELIPIFQNIAGQSSRIGASLKESADLTLSFAAALGTLKIPLDQQRQEVSSILQANISNDSILAKTLGITNEMVEKYRSQGKLVEFLNSKLEVFRASNKLAAETIDGAASNIKELFDEVGRQAGQPLFEGLTKGLNDLYKFLAQNQDQIVNFFTFLTEGALESGTQIAGLLKPALEQTFKIFTESADLTANLFTIIKDGAVTATAVLAPLLNLLGAIVEKTIEGYKALSELILLRQINDQVDALDNLQKVTNTLGQEATNAASRFKELQAIQANGGKLTADQQKEFAALKGQIKDLLPAIDQQIAAYKALPAATPELQAQNQANIKSLERLKEALQGTTGSVKLAGKGAEDLGSDYDQLAKKAESLKAKIENPGTESADLQKAAQDYLKIVQTQRDLGAISTAEAEKQLNAIANNTKIETSVRRQAVETLSKIRKDDLDDQKADLDVQLEQIQSNVETGKLTQEQGAKQTTEIKKQQLDLQLADLEKAIAAEQAAIAKGAGSKERLEDLQRQQKKAIADRQKVVVDGEKAIQDARLKEIEKAEKKAQDIAKEAETQRSIQIQKLVNAGVIDKEEADFRRLQSTRQTLDAELKAEQASLAQLNKLPKQSNPEAEEKRQQAIRQSRQRTGELTLKQLENEKQQQEALTRVIQKRIDRELQGIKNNFEASKQSLEKQAQLQQALVSILEQQQKILGARGDLQKSLNDLTQSQYSNAIKLLEGIGSEEDRQRARQKDGFQARLSALEIEQKLKRKYTEEERKARVAELQQQLLDAGGVDNDRTKKLKEELDLLEQLGDANAKARQQEREDQIRNLKIEAKKAEIAAAEQEFQIQQQSLALEQQKTKILAEQEQIRLRTQAIEAKAATAQAQAELAKAAVDKNSTPEQLRALQLAVQASQQREVGIAQQQDLQAQSAKAQEGLFAAQRQSLQAQQNVRRGGLQSDLAQLTPGTEDDQALLNQQASGARQTAEASQQAGSSLKKFSDQLDQTSEKLKQGIQPPPNVPQTAQPIAAQVLAQPLTGQQVAPLQNDLNPLTEQFRNMPQNVSNQLARINTPMAGQGAIDSSPIADFAGEILGAIEGLTNAVVNGFSNASMGNATFNLQSKNLIADGADLYARVQRSRFAAQGL